MFKAVRQVATRASACPSQRASCRTAAGRRLGAVRTRSLASSSSAANRSAKEALASWPATQHTTLANGLRVASETTLGSTATVGVWVDTGSRYESKEKNGAAHFLEHMIFKGTANRTQRRLEQEVEDMGGHLNAYTSRESTVFYAKVQKQDVEKAMDILADILQNSDIDAGAVERERDTILREQQEVESQLEEVVFDDLHETAYQKCSLGRTILGPSENIESITRDDIVDYISTHYTAPRMVIAGAGAVEHEQLAGIAEAKFGKVPATAPNGEVAVKEPAIFTGSNKLTRYDDYPHAHVAFAFETVGWNHQDSFPLMVMQSMLGSWDSSVSGGVHSSSKLISKVAETNMAQSISAFNSQHSDTGLFGVYAVAEEQALNDLMYLITYEMVRLAYQVNPAHLEEAKNQLKMNMLASLDGTTPICEDIGRQMLSHGRRMHPAEIIERIDAVDAAAVKNAANEYIYDRDHALAAIGPIHELPDYNFLRRRSYWMRY